MDLRTLHYRTIQFDCINVLLPRIAVVRSQVNDPGLLVDFLHLERLEITAGELPLQLGLGTEWILLIEAVEV